jgi:ubiquinone/menaquinone biosynthesis C-methylase UbiE
MTDKHDPHIQIEKGNSWYVADQFEQLDKPGTRVIIEQRWKCFGRVLRHYLKNRVSHDKAGPLRYLDAGCGDGINLQWTSGFFRKQCIDVRVTALDYNSLRIDRVKQKQLAKETQVASLLEMPFSDSTFDIVLCSHVLEHIEQYHKALTEILRILKPGGLLLLGVPNEGCFFAQLRNKVIQRSILRKTDHINFFRSNTINEALLNTGFNVVKIYREGFFLPHFWVQYVLNCFILGGKLLSILGQVFPSQSGGIIVYAIKPLFKK